MDEALKKQKQEEEAKKKADEATAVAGNDWWEICSFCCWSRWDSDAGDGSCVLCDRWKAVKYGGKTYLPLPEELKVSDTLAPLAIHPHCCGCSDGGEAQG